MRTASSDSSAILKPNKRSLPRSIPHTLRPVVGSFSRRLNSKMPPKNAGSTGSVKISITHTATKVPVSPNDEPPLLMQGLHHRQAARQAIQSHRTRWLRGVRTQRPPQSRALRPRRAQRSEPRSQSRSGSPGRRPRGRRLREVPAADKALARVDSPTSIRCYIRKSTSESVIGLIHIPWVFVFLSKLLFYVSWVFVANQSFPLPYKI